MLKAEVASAAIAAMAERMARAFELRKRDLVMGMMKAMVR